MKSVIKISIIVLIILIFAIVGAFAYLYFGTDIFKTDKQMYLKYASESKDFIYNQLKDEDLDAYKNKLKNTPYENNGKITVKVESNSSNKSKEVQFLENSNVTIAGKVDKANKINLQNIKINYPQQQTIDIDLLLQDDTYGFRINSILKNYLAVENNNLKEWAKILGLDEEQINLIPEKIDNTLFDSIISEDELNQLIEKYSKLIVNKLDDDMFSKTNQGEITVYSFKINEKQVKDIALDVLENVKEDESIWQIVKNMYTGFSLYSKEEIDEQINEMKKSLDEALNEYIEDNFNQDDIDEDDIDEDDYDEDDLYQDTTDIATEDRILVYNMYVEMGELIKTELINDSKSQTISKTEKGISIENKETYYGDQEEIIALNIEKNKEEDKLIYRIELTENSELLGEMSIGYRGLSTLEQIEEVAILDSNLFQQGDSRILQRAEKAREETKRANEEDEVKIAVSSIVAAKLSNTSDAKIKLNDLKNVFIGKNFEYYENRDGTFKIISKDTNNEYTIDTSGRVEIKEPEDANDMDLENAKRKYQYYNKNTFNENLEIDKVEDSKIWKMNGKDANQIVNVFENISTKMEEANIGQNTNSYEGYAKDELITGGLIPYFSIVGIDNIEYDQLTLKNVASYYVGAFIGLLSARNSISTFNEINYPSLEQEVNRLNR